MGSDMFLAESSSEALPIVNPLIERRYTNAIHAMNCKIVYRKHLKVPHRPVPSFHFRGVRSSRPSS